MAGPQGVRPRLGLRPTSPQAEAGIRIEPAPSLPCARGTAPAATRAAAPPLEPPTPRSRFQGLRVGPCLTDSVEKLITSSGTVVRPRVTSPASRKRVIRSVSNGATAPRMARLPRKNGTPLAIGPLSLMRKGTPANGPSAVWSSAGSNSGRARPLRSAFAASSAWRAALSTSAAVTSPARIRSRSPIASYLAYSLGSTAHPALSGRIVAAVACAVDWFFEGLLWRVRADQRLDLAQVGAVRQ